MIDCALISMPPLLLNGPHLGPGVLKAYAQSKGFTVKCFNPSVNFSYHLLEDDKKSWPYTVFDKAFEERYDVYHHVDSWIDEVLETDPKLIGLSIHTWSGEYFTYKICERLRARRPFTPIALGGSATIEVADGLFDAGLIDYHVVGDGEEAFVNMLEGKFDHPSLNTKVPHAISPEEFKKLPYPDFSDSDFEFFKKQGKENRLYLIGSRGCVFDCSFCNVPTMMKYRFKDGEEFAEEIRFMQDKHETAVIEFGDSLINGSLREFRRLIKRLADLNRMRPFNKPKIVSFYRIRPEKQAPEEDFALMAEAGFYRLKIGVESGSDTIRKHMGKTETNEDILYTLRMCQKYNMNVNFLIIVGYPTETEKDFQDTMDMLKLIHESGLDSVVDRAVVNELYISTGTGLYQQIEELDIKDALGTAEEKMDRPWSRTLPNGEVINAEVREQRLKTAITYIQDNFSNAGKLMVFSGKEDSNRKIEGDKT
jgi:radical SAM superfamily enzyme YgiQ (UPF0313 family)